MHARVESTYFTTIWTIFKAACANMQRSDYEGMTAKIAYVQTHTRVASARRRALHWS